LRTGDKAEDMDFTESCNCVGQSQSLAPHPGEHPADDEGDKTSEEPAQHQRDVRLAAERVTGLSRAWNARQRTEGRQFLPTICEAYRELLERAVSWGDV
jgi:hypothetical protein